MSRTRSAGFVITLEFLLIMALFVVPVVLGLIMLGRKAYTLYLAQREFIEQPYSRGVVWDSTNVGPTPPPKIVGPVTGYDAFEAPLVVFRDNANKAGVVLGVRRDRFTSYGEVFYTDNLCTLTPRVRVADASNPADPVSRPATATGISGAGTTFVGLPTFSRVGAGPFVLATPGWPPIGGYPPAGFAYQMQGVSYAMGNGNVLYFTAATLSTSITSDGTNLFVWKSQDVTPVLGGQPFPQPQPPCFAVPNGVQVRSLADATAVIDFDGPGNFKPPFRLAFPSPGTGPALPCPTGECP